jgi:hypothetical protein
MDARDTPTVRVVGVGRSGWYKQDKPVTWRATFHATTYRETSDRGKVRRGMNPVKHVDGITSQAEEKNSSDHRKAKKSADARQLFTEHYVQYAGSTDLGLHQHHAWMIGNDLSDDDGVAPKLVLLHLM